MVFDVPPAVVITTCADWVPDGARRHGDAARVLGRAAGRCHLAVEGGDDLTRRAQEVRTGHLDGLAGTPTRGVQGGDDRRAARVGRRRGGGRRRGTELELEPPDDFDLRRCPWCSAWPCGEDGAAVWAAVGGGALGPPPLPPPPLVPSVTARAPAATRSKAAATHTAISSGLRPPRRRSGGRRWASPSAGVDSSSNRMSTAWVGGPPSCTSRARCAAAAMAPRARTPGCPRRVWLAVVAVGIVPDHCSNSSGFHFPIGRVACLLRHAAVLLGVGASSVRPWRA